MQEFLLPHLRKVQNGDEMTDIAVQRELARIDAPPIDNGLSESHWNRALIAPGNWTFTDPFLLLMEDWLPDGVFDRHPHRGIETVTYVIEGEIEHYDNHGQRGDCCGRRSMAHGGTRFDPQ